MSTITNGEPSHDNEVWTYTRWDDTEVTIHASYMQFAGGMTVWFDHNHRVVHATQTEQVFNLRNLAAEGGVEAVHPPGDPE